MCCTKCNAVLLFQLTFIKINSMLHITSNKVHRGVAILFISTVQSFKLYSTHSVDKNSFFYIYYTENKKVISL